MDGSIQVYYGNGRGKTTAALGLGIRAAGVGKQVIMVQFLKKKHSDTLDFLKKLEPELQKAWFVRQLGLAREKKLPVIIHSRDAAKDTLDIMKAEKAGEIGGVIHCFSYSLDYIENIAYKDRRKTH